MQVLFVSAALTRSKRAANLEAEVVKGMVGMIRSRLMSVPRIRFVERNVVNNPPQLIDSCFVNAQRLPQSSHTPQQKERLRESDKMVSEVLSSQAIVLGCPVYSYGIPLPLLVWLQSIQRQGKTFELADGKRYGRLHDKMVLAVMSELDAGGSASARLLDYLREKFALLGVRKFEVVRQLLDRQSTPSRTPTPVTLEALELQARRLRMHLQEAAYG